MKRDEFGYNLNSLDYQSKGRRKESSGQGIGKRFYTSLDMAIIKRDIAHRNSEIKRGLVERKGNEHISVCGCGSEGCFIHSGYDSVPMEQMARWEKDQAERRRKSRKWSEWK